MAENELTGAEADAKRILEGLGFLPRKIPTSSNRSADFDVAGDDPAYLVEVKSRQLDLRLANPTKPIGEPVTKLMHHDAKVGEWLAESKQQFRALDPNHDRLWFLWCSMESPFGALNQLERTLKVLYGVLETFDLQPPYRNAVVFYAMKAAFERFADSDGALVAVPEMQALTFCPNEYSPRLATVMNSKLVRELRANDIGPLLPHERAARVGGYVVPPEIRGSEHVTILRHVQRALGSAYLNFMLGDTEYLQTGRVVLPGDEGD